ncbi:MAG: 3-hydroxyacyl-CoA dehydrogenase family protein [Proteobacteria bacterium]|nr:3-hydroxyacyl-CoA dehydrogenase family protein [Pseudomonadota bacterium]
MTIRKLGVMGAGTMGSGIAQSAAQSGYAVIMVDTNDAAVERALDGAAKTWDRGVEKGRLTETDAEAAKTNLSASASMDDLHDADLVIEAVFEDFDVKAALFRALGKVVAADAILATNTSSFRVDDLARHVAEPERFLGMHYFVPANINKLVEVVRGQNTAEATFATALDFARSTAKEPLACRDSYGFVVNRFFCPCVNEGVRLVDEGHAPERVDAVSRQVFGSPLGVLTVMNLSKARIAMNACTTLGGLGAFYEPCTGLIRMGEADAAWEFGEEPAADNAADAAIADRLRGATFLAALELLDEEVAAPDAIDLGAFHGLRWETTPCSAMDDLGQDGTIRLVEAVAALYGRDMPRSTARAGSLLVG